MDTSEKYIKMCAKAQEIQDLRKEDNVYEEGDFFSESDLTYSVAYCFSSCIEYADDGYRDAIKKKESHETWLPRQDQLQEMIGDESVIMNFGLELFNSFHVSNHKLYGFYRKFLSNEQLWLAYIMKQKYDKSWSEEKGKWKRIKV